MNLILIVREEIICLIILLFILLSSRLYKMGKDRGNFLRICIFAIGHIVFDLITVLTVNRPDVVPLPINWICHIIFYMFALLYSYEFFCYTISLCYAKKVLRRVRYVALIPLLLYFAAVPFLPMDYLKGDGTNYSFGAAAIAGYGVAMVIFIASVTIVLRHRKKLDKHIVFSLLPMLGVAIMAEIIQIAVPEMLFTGGTVTIITVGFFFSLENPVVVLKQKVLTDAMTGVKSRHSYEADILKMEHKFASGVQYGMAYFDINDLKTVNDTRGHLEGDSYIGCVAQILMNCLKEAETIYRMGGDEFLAVYQEKSLDVIRREATLVEAACAEESQKRSYPVSLAIGYSLSDSGYQNLRDVLRTADYQMYSNKAKIKRQRAYLLSGSAQLNITGLTDRIFEAFASTDTNRFFYVTNMATNVTRWSHSAVEYFGLDSEFIYDCSNVWLERVHPEDRNTFFDDISAVFSGNQKNHNLEYRLQNGSGNYVTCSATGTILRGKNGDPDLFAGTLFAHTAGESLDNLTALRNGFEMMNYLNTLINTHTPASILKLSILNLNRINMLYGYVSGNDILRQFSQVIRSVVGSAGSVFRAEGTKFVVCLPNFSRNDTVELYRKIEVESEHQIRLDTLTPPLQLAAGGFLLSDDFSGTASILRSNLIFVHDRSKYEERGRLIFYDRCSTNAQNIDRKNQILLSIHQDAIANREGFYIVYQSIVQTSTGKIVGAEALLRWNDKTFGVINPSDFIPWLEGDPCFFSLGNWILRSALTEASRLLAYQPEFVVNINISMSQLEHEGFRKAVLDILEETGFPPAQLCLELTERCRELSMDYLKEEIEFFRSHGIRVALDDLGTGFSSFGLLLCLNVDELKLDRAFVNEIRTQRVNQVLTRMVIEASKSMGYTTCLEGVADETLRRYLADYDATYYQGFFCDRPTRIDEFMLHMKEWNAAQEQTC